MEKKVITFLFRWIIKSDIFDLCLDVIGESKIYITEVVKKELKKSRIYEKNKDLIGLDGPIIVLEYQKVENTQYDLSFLGAGELSCINYCLENDSKLLVDDREARDEAKRLGIKTLTIPDLLLLGKRKNKIGKDEMKTTIKALKKEDNYLFSEEVKEELLEYS